MFVYAMASKEKYSKLRCIWLAVMLLDYDSDLDIDFFERDAFVFKIFIENVRVAFTKILDFKELAHFNCFCSVLNHRWEVWVKLLNLFRFRID